MQKPFFILFALLLGTSFLSAQHLGFRGGVNFTNVTVKAEGISVSFDNQATLLLGTFLDLPVGSANFMLSPELSYMGRSFGIGSDNKATLNYLDLGLLAKYLLVNNESIGVYAAAGPVIGYALSGTEKDGNTKTDIEFEEDDGFNRLSSNLALAGGLIINQHFFAEVRYTLGLSSLVEGEDADGGTLKWKSIGINVGARLALGN